MWTIYTIYKKATRISVAFVPGPEPESFLLGAHLEDPIPLRIVEDNPFYLGNLPELFQSQVGEPDFKFQRLYGDVTRIKGPFGVRDALNPVIGVN